MPLYVLRPLVPEDLPFTPRVDRNFGFVVEAPDEATARVLASAEAKSEGAAAWLDAGLTGIELAEDGDAHVVLADYVP